MFDREKISPACTTLPFITSGAQRAVSSSSVSTSIAHYSHHGADFLYSRSIRVTPVERRLILCCILCEHADVEMTELLIDGRYRSSVYALLIHTVRAAKAFTERLWL